MNFLTRCQLVGINDGLNFGDGQAVDQRLQAQIRIDEGGDDAEFAQSQPGGYVLGLVGHEQRHRVSLHVARVLEHPSYSVAVLVDLQKYKPNICQLRSLRVWPSNLAPNCTAFLEALRGAYRPDSLLHAPAMQYL